MDSISLETVFTIMKVVEGNFLQNSFLGPKNELTGLDFSNKVVIFVTDSLTNESIQAVLDRSVEFYLSLKNS